MPTARTSKRQPDDMRIETVCERKDILHNLSEAQKRPRVSDHALIRYCERVEGIDFEGMREAIMTESVKQAIKMGAKSVKMNGITLKISGTTITTVID